MNRKRLGLVIIGLLALVPPVAWSADVTLTPDGKVPGTPFQNLQDQINNIQLTPGPKGDTGATGPVGPAGPQGAIGLTGPAGADGISPTTEELASGDPNCAYGGIKLNSSSGPRYICNPPPAGIESINMLNNLPCVVGISEGRVSLTFDSANNVNLKCDVFIYNLKVTLSVQTSIPFSRSGEFCNYHIIGSYPCNCYTYNCGTIFNPQTCTTCSTCYTWGYDWCTITGVSWPLNEVISSPPGISVKIGGYDADVGVAGPEPKEVTASFPSNTAVTLTSPGTTFSGDCVGFEICTVIINGNKNVTATR